MEEKDRLKFVEERDGHQAMLKFAEQGLYAYLKASINNSKYKESIEAYINVLEKNDFKIDILNIRNPRIKIGSYHRDDHVRAVCIKGDWFVMKGYGPPTYWDEESKDWVIEYATYTKFAMDEVKALALLEEL